MSADFPVVYEDNHILVAVKPQNIPSQTDDSRDESFQEMVRSYIRDKYDKPGNVYTGLIHRLDRPTGGLMVFARTSKAAARLTREVKDHALKKVYYAVISGDFHVLGNTGRMEDWLIKDRTKNTSRVGRENEEDAKKALLTYRVLAEHTDYALVRIDLQTGRSHQIRVQFASRGVPLVGDCRYGGRKASFLCLWAGELSFHHPTRKEEMFFSWPYPQLPPWDLFAHERPPKEIRTVSTDRIQ